MKKLKKISLDNFNQLSDSESAQLFGGIVTPKPITISTPTIKPTVKVSISTGAIGVSVSLVNGVRISVSLGKGGTSGGLVVGIPINKH